MKKIGVAHQWLNDSFIYFIRDAYMIKTKATQHTYFCTHCACMQSRKVKSQTSCGFLNLSHTWLSLIFCSYKSRNLYVNNHVNCISVSTRDLAYMITYYDLQSRVDPADVLMLWVGHVSGCFRPSCDCSFAIFCTQLQHPFFF